MGETHLGRSKPLRHLCTGCGRSCHGAGVLLQPTEVPSVRVLAQQLGLPDPVDGKRLKMIDGRCLFQQDDGLCGIHARWGLHAKPLICRQYPLVVVRAEEGLRSGIDPSCYTSGSTWRDAPAIDEGQAMASRVSLPPDQQAFETAFLQACEAKKASIRSLFAALPGVRVGPDGLPRGFATRWIETLQAHALQDIFQDPDVGSALPVVLEPIFQTIDGLDSSSPPAWPCLSKEDEAWAVEATRRVIFLRLNHVSLPTVMGVALLMLGGAVLCGWATHGTDGFGTAFSGWLRALRFRAFWTRLVPDPARLRWLATGK